MIGGLVAKTLTTSSTNPYAQGGAGARAAPVALDVFSVQVCAALTACMLSGHCVALHFAGLLQNVNFSAQLHLCAAALCLCMLANVL